MLRKSTLTTSGIVLTLVLSVLPARAQVEQVTLRIDGLACPFCAYGLEKKIKQLEGYKSSNVLINEGKVVVVWREDKPLDLSVIYNAVQKAGFTLRVVNGSFVGHLSTNDGKYFLVLPKPINQRFYVYEETAFQSEDKTKKKSTHIRNHKKEGTPEGLSETRRDQMDQLIARKMIIRIIGSVHRHKDEELPPAIEIKQLENINTNSD